MKALLLAALLAAAPALSAPVSDPAGDFLPSYTGPLGGDVDILSGAVTRRDGMIQFDVEVAANFGTTPNVLAVWAINRGAGTPRLSFLAPPVAGNLPFDALFVMFDDGSARAVTFVGMVPTITLLPGAANIAGSTMQGFVSTALYTSTGFALEDYTYGLWTRQRINPVMDSGNFEVADLLNGGNPFRASVPEPASWAMLILGFGAIGTRLRRAARAPRPA